jgi:hypothetical protein
MLFDRGEKPSACNNMYINFRDDMNLNVASIYVVFVTIESFVMMIDTGTGSPM